MTLQTLFGDTRALLARSSWTLNQLLPLLESACALNHNAYHEQWIPYLQSHLKQADELPWLTARELATPEEILNQFTALLPDISFGLKIKPSTFNRKKLKKLPPLSLSKLCTSPALAQVQELEIACLKLDQDHLNDLSMSPHTKHVRRLKLQAKSFQLTASHLELSSLLFYELKHLDLSQCGLDDHTLATLLKPPAFQKLTTLILSKNNLTDASAFMLSSGDPYPHLRVLDLSSNAIRSAGAEALLEAPFMSTIERLKLGCIQVSARTHGRLLNNSVVEFSEYKERQRIRNPNMDLTFI